CARIGAVHSVVFGGFSAESLRDRINDQKARLLVTADGGYRRGQIVPLKQVADEALDDAPSIENVIVVQRGSGPEHGAGSMPASAGSMPGTAGSMPGTAGSMPAFMKEGRDHWYHR